MRKILCLLSFIFLFFSSKGQYNLINYTVDDGLPSQETYFVHQDYDGYIWICTDRGVARYNGYEFKNFNTNDGLTYNTVFRIYEDKSHNLWMSCYDGTISIFEYATKKFKPFWGNKVFEQSEEKFRVWPASIGFLDSTVSIFMSSGTESALSSDFYTFNLNKLTHSNNIIKDSLLIFENLQIKYYSVIYRDWYGNESSLLKRDEIYDFRDSNKSIIEQKKPIEHYQIIYFNDEHIMFDLKSIFIINKDTIKVSIPGRVTDVLRDFEGNYWVSTLASGIFKIHSLDVNVIDFNSNIKKNEKIVGLENLGNHVLVGTSLGNYFDHNLATKSISKLKVNSVAQANLFKVDDVLLSNAFLFKEINGNILIEDKRLTYDYPAKMKKIDRNLYLGYYNHAPFWFSTGILYRDSISTFINNEKILDLHVLSKNQIFYSTPNHFYRMNWKGKKTMLKDFYKLGNSSVKGINSLKDSSLVIGTNGQGVIIDFSDTVVRLTENLGLVSNLVNDVLVDQNDVIWCATNRGISKIFFDSEKEVTIENFNYSNGLPSSYVDKLYLFESEIWSFSANKIYHFNSNLSLKKEKTPKIRIQSIEHEDIQFNSNSVFKSNENNLTVRYLGISSNKPISKHFYFYQLERNKEKLDWVSTNNTSVDLTDLKSGDYVFHIKAQTQNGIWSEIKEISFTIKPHWTRIWWVQALFWGFIALFIWLFIRRRIRIRQNLLKKEIEYEQIDNKLKTLELDVLRGQMNPHLIYNALNSAQALMIQDDKIKATEFINKLSKLLRSSLEYSRQEFIPIEDEISFLTNYLEIETQRFPDRFRYEINCEEKLKDELVSPLIIQPLCENVVKHSFEGKMVSLNVDFKVLNLYYYQVTISDDGKGFDVTKKNTGILENNKKSSLGLVILKRRIIILKEKFPVTSYKLEFLDKENKKGTKITLVLPIVE